MAVEKNLIIEDARIGFRNFSGRASQFNREGDRNFCVFLDEKFGKQLEKDGWHIRWLKPRNEDDEPTASLQVAVRFNNYPPKVVLVSSSGKNILTEKEVDTLDHAELENVDLVIRPYNYDVNGHKGTKAYLKNGYFTIYEDELDKKYADKPKEEDDEDDVPF